jgi:methyl-accepting chemotaxis protein
MSDLDPAPRSTLGRVAKRKSAPDEAPDSLQDLLHALQAMRGGDFSVRMTGDHLGVEGKIADTFNEIVAANQRMAQQLERVGQVVGREGKTRQRVKFDLASGSWADMEGSVNTLIDDLLWPTREVTPAVDAVAQGDLLQTVKLDVDGRPLGGEFLQSANIVNTMIKQLSVFTSEVTRVAREVGTEAARRPGAGSRGDGGLEGPDRKRELDGQQPHWPGSQHRRSDHRGCQRRLVQKITVDVRGEILQLKEAINTMVDQLRSFASEVTRVAREVGTDGKLGARRSFRGRRHLEDLTDSVNAMCGNLTAQVRNIANVTTAVARRPFAKITVDVRGEILS